MNISVDVFYGKPMRKTAADLIATLNRTELNIRNGSCLVSSPKQLGPSLSTLVSVGLD